MKQTTDYKVSNNLMDMKMDSRISSSTIKSWGGDLGFGELKTVYQYWYPNYYGGYLWQPDKFAQAFKVVSMMIEKEYIKGITLKKFIKIVKEVEESL